MTSAPAAMTPHRGFRHEGLKYRGITDFLADTVAFVIEGVRAGQPVAVAVTGERLERMHAALGEYAAHVQFFDMAEVGRNPACLIPIMIDFVTEYGADGRPLRAVGEPLSAARGPDEVAECELHEALVNLAIHPDCAFWLRCLYDATEVGDAVLAEAARSHPILLEDGAYRGSTTYGGAHHAGELFAAELPALPAPDRRVDFGGDSLDVVDDAVQHHTTLAGVDREQADRLLRAAHEVATNSVRHGGGAGNLRIWHRADTLVFEIENAATIRNPLVGRTPPARGTAGHGLWRVNHLADLVQIRSNDRHTIVRIVDRLDRVDR